LKRKREDERGYVELIFLSRRIEICEEGGEHSVRRRREEREGRKKRMGSVQFSRMVSFVSEIVRS
jgi:hypothetical protein